MKVSTALVVTRYKIETERRVTADKDKELIPPKSNEYQDEVDRANGLGRNVDERR